MFGFSPKQYKVWGSLLENGNAPGWMGGDLGARGPDAWHADQGARRHGWHADLGWTGTSRGPNPELARSGTG